MSSALVRVRGLPWGAGQEEVNQFFQALELDQEQPVTLVNGLGGRPTGEAFVRFATPEAAAEALSFNRETLGKRYIEVFPATEQDLQQSVQRQGVRDFSDGILRCRGLPFNCAAADVAAFFVEYGITEEHVTMGLHLSGQFSGSPNGEAWVKFGDETMAKRALEERNMKTMGSRYVELYLSSEAERQQFQRLPARGRNMGRGPGDLRPMYDGAVEGGECWLRARGLPFSCGPMEVADFFSGHGVFPHDVVLSQHPDGRPTGEALVRFQSVHAAETARQMLHRQLMGSRYVELFPVGPGEWLVQGMPAVGSGADPLRNEYRGQQFGDVYSVAPYAGVAGFPPGALWGYGGAYPSGASPYPAIAGAPYAAQGGLLPAAPYGGAAGACAGGAGVYPGTWGPSGFAAGPGAYMAFPATAQQPYRPYQSSSTQATVDYHWLHARGFPASAQASDIAGLFGNFGVSERDVILALSPTSRRPTGEAFIRFISPEEAQAAIAQLDKHLVGPRQIELQPCAAAEAERAVLAAAAVGVAAQDRNQVNGQLRPAGGSRVQHGAGQDAHSNGYDVGHGGQGGGGSRRGKQSKRSGGRSNPQAAVMGAMVATNLPGSPLDSPSSSNGQPFHGSGAFGYLSYGVTDVGGSTAGNNYLQAEQAGCHSR